MKQDERRTLIALCLFGIFPVIWLALLIAPAVSGGLPEIMARFPAAMNDPFHIAWCEDSLKTVLVFLCCYGLGIGVYFSSRRNYRRREEHGSAKWGDAGVIDRKYRQRPASDNKLLTQNVGIGLDAKRHRRNLNTLVCGGSGAGKTRSFAKPNLYQANTSFVVLDPKGELARDAGALLEAKGYEVRVLDLLHMEKSFCYNPFVYLRDDNDVQRLVTNLFKSTTPKGSQSQDPFWDTAASMLLLALVFYLKYEAPPDEQNFPMVMEMLRAADVREDDDSYESPLDELFERLEMRDPDHIAVKYYKDYHSGSAKTLKSIQITLAARLEKFNLSSLAALTATDELDLPSLGEKKVALFALIPDNDTSFNFLVSILYTQLFQQLFDLADHRYYGALPVPVHFLMDEFANVSLPDDFERILATMRSRNISVSIILQNLAQLKALFEKQWESIIGLCDEFLYLGGNEQSTHKYVSELLGTDKWRQRKMTNMKGAMNVGIVRFLEYIVVFSIILSFSNIYANSTTEYYLAEISIVLTVILLLVRLWLYKIKKIVFLRWMFWLGAYYIFLFPVLVFSVNGNTRVEFVEKFNLLLPIYTFLFAQYAQKEEENVLLWCYSNVMTGLALISVLFWFSGSLMGWIKPSGYVTVDWGGVHQYPCYWGAYAEYQRTPFFGQIYIRNQGIFCEGPMHTFCLVLAIAIKLFIPRPQNTLNNTNNPFRQKALATRVYSRIGLLTLYIALISTVTTTGMIMLIFMLILDYMKMKTRSNPSRMLKWMLALVVLTMGAFFMIQIYIEKATSGSWAIRTDDFAAGFKAWSQSPIYGTGFQSLEGINVYKDSSRFWNGGQSGYSNGVAQVLAQGGLILFAIYLFPLLWKAIDILKKQMSGEIAFICILFIEFTFTLVSYTSLMLFMLGFFYGSWLGKKSKKQRGIDYAKGRNPYLS